MARISDKSTEELLEMVLYYIQRMEKRDKWRTIGGTIRSLIMFIPVILLLGSSWYFYEHSDEVIKSITKSMTEQMTSFMPTSEQIQEMMNGGIKKQ